MTDDELRAIVASNAQAIERNAQAIERNAQTMANLEQKLDGMRQQISLLTRQVQMLVDVQSRHSNSITILDRHANGVYDILQTYAREQNDRFELISQQIQALVDERRRA